jgi:hypothetical protein
MEAVVRRSLSIIVAILSGCTGKYTAGDLADAGKPPVIDDVDAAGSHGPPPAPDAAPIDDGRVKVGLQAIYKLKGGTGTTVHDQSGAGAALDLTIADPVAATWGPTGLTFNAATIVKSDAPATKIITACMASGEITVEAWATPASLDPPVGGPSRIVTLSVDTATRNFSLLQNAADYEFRLRTEATDLNGTNPSLTSTGTVTTAAQHIVYTRDTAGNASFYINGAKQPSAPISLGFSTWDPSYVLAFGNEITLDRPWLGTLHLVAIYCRALTAAEVGQNYSASF